MPNVDVKGTSSKGSYTLPTRKSKEKKAKEPKVKTEKKSGLFASVFRHSSRSSKAPALDLPPIDRDIKPNNPPSDAYRLESDPLRVPFTDLPKADFPLPTLDRPEVAMTKGQTKQSSEFAVPAVDLPAVPNLPLPNECNETIGVRADEMKIPIVHLPDLRLTGHEDERVQLPEIDIRSNGKRIESESVTVLPVISSIDAKATALPSMHPAELEIQHPSTIETDYEIRTESMFIEQTIPALPHLTLDEADIVIQPELLSTEQKYTIADTHFVQPPELPLLLEKQTTESLDSVPKLPDFAQQLPSVSIFPTDSKSHSASSFEDRLPTISAPVVIPSIEVASLPKKSSEKQAIEPKSDIKKKSSTLALCSCFGNKSNAQKEKSHTIAAPKASLPNVDLPLPSSNLSSALKTKGSLRAPGNELPAVVFSEQTSEPARLPTIHTLEKKRQAPKKPIAPEDKDTPQMITLSPEAVVPASAVDQVNTQPTSGVPSIEIRTDEDLLITPSMIETDAQEKVNAEPSSPLPILEQRSEEDVVARSTTTIETERVNEVTMTSASAASTIEQHPTVRQAKVGLNDGHDDAMISVRFQETSTEPKKSLSFDMRAPALHIPALDLSGPQSIDGYISSSKHEQSVSTIAPLQSRSDSGLEAIISSHLPPSSTFDTNPTMTDLQQPTSISSGLGSEIMDSMTTQGYQLTAPEQEKLTREPKRENSVLRHDFARKITINDESRSKLIFRQNELKACLETEISRSMDAVDAKKDQKTLSRIITHAVDLIKEKKVSTYPELKQKLLAEHKNDAAIVDPVVRALYCTMEKQGLDNVDKPEFPLAIRDVSQRTMIYGSVTIFSFIHSSRWCVFRLNKRSTPFNS